MSAMSKFFRKVFPQPERARLAEETDNTFLLGGRTWNHEDRDRFDYDREEMLRLSLDAWRVNPLARRIVGLTTQYVVGGGMRYRADHPETHKFIDQWWNHRLNQLPMRVYEWCDELTRAGELFLLLTTDAAGMTYIRAIPAMQVKEILTAENDLQQERAYVLKAEQAGDEQIVQAYDDQEDSRGDDGAYAAVMLHYAITGRLGLCMGRAIWLPCCAGSRGMRHGWKTERG